jgi:gamma-glutamyl:cysteine ligase YbdK (ATP-grasp superfamily)
MSIQNYSTVTDYSKSSLSFDTVINQPSIQVCFTVSKRFNNLLQEVNPDAYSEKQLQTYRIIKSLYDKGLSYRRITKQLNDKGITTHKGNHVHSIVKKKRLKDEKLEKEYPEVGSDFRLDIFDNILVNMLEGL